MRSAGVARGAAVASVASVGIDPPDAAVAGSDDDDRARLVDRERDRDRLAARASPEREAARELAPGGVALGAQHAPGRALRDDRVPGAVDGRADRRREAARDHGGRAARARGDDAAAARFRDEETPAVHAETDRSGQAARDELEL